MAQDQCFRNVPNPLNIAVMKVNLSGLQVNRAPARTDDEARFREIYRQEEANGTKRLFEMWTVAGARSTKQKIPARLLGSWRSLQMLWSCTVTPASPLQRHGHDPQTGRPSARRLGTLCR